MNRRILDWGAPDDAGDAGLDVWHALGDIRVPVTVAWGELDVPADVPFYRKIADRIPGAVARPLPGTAHLPSIDRPEVVADLVRERLAG
jgi:pimeloyl-ACP methyl ester carboxylesterase